MRSIQRTTACGFDLIDHPADLGIEAWGQSMVEAFEQAATGLMSVILDIESVRCQQTQTVTLCGTDLEQLLVKWLAEILYLYDGMRFAAVRFEIVELTAESLSAKVHGEPFSSDRHIARLDVKAITYHQLLCEQTSAGARLRVFLDI